MSNEEAILSFDSVNCCSVVSVADAVTNNRFCTVVCDIIGMEMSVEVWTPSSDKSLSLFDSISSISIVLSNDSVKLIFASVCVNSLASESMRACIF